MRHSVKLKVAFLASLLFASRVWSQHGLAGQVDQYMHERVVKDHFSGSVLIARDGKILFEKGYGLAEREWDAPNSELTRFRVASVTKQFTAAAILLLQEKKQVNLNEKAAAYLPSLPSAWKSVTLHQLLVHTSGIPNYIPEAEKHQLNILGATPQDLLDLVKDKPLAFPAGTQQLYSNTNYVLLGMIVEQISRLSYADFLQKFIFTPLALENTGFDSSERIVPQRAAPYRWHADHWENIQPYSSGVTYSAGGLYSTVGDLLLWDEALQHDRLLSEASRNAMFTPYPETLNGDQSEGYGVIIAKDQNQPVWIATGNISGYAAAALHYSVAKLYVVVLSNVDKAPSVPIGARLAGFVLEPKPSN